MHLYIYISIYLYTYISIYLYTYISIVRHHAELRPPLHIYISLSVHTHANICVPICIHACMYMSLIYQYTCGSTSCVHARERACQLLCALAHVCLCLYFCVPVSVWLPACSPARPTNARTVCSGLLAAPAPSAPACLEPKQYMRQCGATAAAYALNASAGLAPSQKSGMRPGPVSGPTDGTSPT